MDGDQIETTPPPSPEKKTLKKTRLIRAHKYPQW